jgi:glycosyltransferase involved in cell wall biosynthesis
MSGRFVRFMKILISAYSCGPWPTSEPGNAWRAINHALAQGHEVWTVTETAGYEEPTLKYLAEHPMPGFHPTFFRLPEPIAWMRRPGVFGNVYYHLWQQKLMSVAQELHKKIGFDVSHHVTFGRYWSPSGLRGLDIPFIWGPVGAAESTPPSFLSELPLGPRLFEFTRDQVRAISVHDPALLATARATTIGIGISRESCEALRKLGVRRVEQLPQAGLPDDDLATFGRIPPPPEGGPFRVICMGRLIHWKGFYLAIRAFAIFARKHPDAELWIISEGPYRRELEATALREGVQSQVHFTGLLPKFSQVLEKLGECHVLMHPALHEAFGNVCMEAMAAGRPVVCLDVGGPAAQVTPETGFAAPVTNPQEAVEAMAAFLTRLADDRGLLKQMSANARERVREKFTMQQLGASFESFYKQAVAMHAETRRARA